MQRQPGWAPHLPADASRDVTDSFAARSLPAIWRERWLAAPDAELIHDSTHGWLSAADLAERTARAAGKLRGLGLNQGDRVLISASTSADLVVAHVACLRAGLVVVPANTGYRAEELGHIVADSKPRLAIVDDDERAGWCRSGAPGLVVLTPQLDVEDHDPPPLDTVGPAAPAMIGYTSGTTGRPKGAVLSQGNLAASVEALLLAWRWSAADRLVLCLPLFHMHGLGVGLHGTLSAGASAVLLARFDVDAVLDAVAEHHATLFFGVPTMYGRLVESPRARELARLRLCVSGSAPLPAALHEAFADVSGQRVLERYGMTETVMLVSNPYDGERRAGTVGFPLPGVELRLSTDGRSEVEVRGPNVFAGYDNRPQENAEAFTADGFFRTGDLGAIDSDGYVTLVGRAKELIISGGFNVYPREVEDALREHPLVVDAAVVGRPDPHWGEAVIAFCEVSGEVGPDELRRWVGDRLAAYKRPQTVVFLTELPRNALGKVQKHLLSDAEHPAAG